MPRSEPAQSSSPIESIVGKPGDPPVCRDGNYGVSVHWFATNAKVGDKCLCGQRTKDA